MQFRKKPVVIEAFQLGTDPIPDWFMDKVTTKECTLRPWEAVVGQSVLRNFRTALSHAEIKTLEGTMRAEAGDFIIKGVKGEIYPCKPDIFAATYEAVNPIRSANSSNDRAEKHEPT